MTKKIARKQSKITKKLNKNTCLTRGEGQTVPKMV